MNNENITFERDGKTVVIHNLKMVDEDTYKFLQETEENKRTETLTTSIKIGITGLKRMNVGSEADYIQREFDSMASKFDRMFDPTIESSHLNKLSNLFKEYFDKGGKIECIFNPMTGNTPIGKLRKELLEEISKTRDMLVKKDAKEEIISFTPLKGFAFEDKCEEILAEVASNHMSDELERTTNEVGEINGCLAGDFVISLGNMSNKKIVFETKDVESISQPKIMETMEKSMKNRGAAYGVFVIKSREGMPKRIGVFNEFRGNILIVALGSKEENSLIPHLLRVAYEWARLRLTMETTIEKKDFGILDEGITQIAEKLDVFSRIQYQCSNIDKASSQIRQHLDDLKADIEQQIQKIQRVISSDLETSGSFTIGEK